MSLAGAVCRPPRRRPLVGAKQTPAPGGPDRLGALTALEPESACPPPPTPHLMASMSDLSPTAPCPPLTREGGCHCGAVRFRVTSAQRRIDDCNCSICQKKAFLHWIVGRQEFELLQGDEALSEYRFGTGTARHTFCKRCGVHSFYVPRSHPDGVSVNLRCVDGFSDLGADGDGFRIEAFDGRHWEANVSRIQG